MCLPVASHGAAAAAHTSGSRVVSMDERSFRLRCGPCDALIAHADGNGCMYNREFCKKDNPYLLALIAQVAPVEVRATAIAPYSPPSNRPMDPPARFARAGAGDCHGHRGATPHRTPSLMAV